MLVQVTNLNANGRIADSIALRSPELVTDLTSNLLPILLPLEWLTDLALSATCCGIPPTEFGSSPFFRKYMQHFLNQKPNTLAAAREINNRFVDWVLKPITAGE